MTPRWNSHRRVIKSAWTREGGTKKVWTDENWEFVIGENQVQIAIRNNINCSV